MVSWEALDALSHQLELCGIGPDTRLVVIAPPDVDPARLGRLRAAVARTGADALEVRPLRTRRAGSEGDLMRAVLERGEVVISIGDPDYFGDLSLPSEDDRAGRRHLHLTSVAEDEFPPHASLRRRVLRLDSLISNGSMLTLRDDFGTDLRIDLTDGVIDRDHGLIDDDQLQASFPAGWAGLQPAAHRVDGELVLMPGDANVDASKLIQSPVRLEIVDDHITTIDGDSADADAVRAQLEAGSGSRSTLLPAAAQAAYGISGFTLGMNPGPALVGAFDERLLDPVLSRIHAGLVTVSFGENLVADRPGPAPLRFVLRSRSVFVDDMAIVRDGLLDADLAPDVYEQHPNARPGLFD